MYVLKTGKPQFQELFESRFNKNKKIRGKDGPPDKKRKRRRDIFFNRGHLNLNREYYVDSVLENIIGQPRASRRLIVRLIWNYIKQHNLQKPGNGRIILPDDRLAALTGSHEEFNGFTLLKHIKQHVISPLQQNGQA